MRLLARLGGWKRLLRYEIRFDKPKTEVHWTDDPGLARAVVGDAPPSHDNKWMWIQRTRVAVVVEPEPASPLPPLEYVRLWASYETRIFVDLGPQAGVAVSALEMAVLSDIGAGSDCVARLGWGDGLQVVDQISQAHSIYTGDFYSRGDVERMIQASFPRAVDGFQVAMSGIALLQYAAVVNRGDPQSLLVLTRTARRIAAYYSALGNQMTAANAFQIAIRAYLEAVAEI